jgi:hypothetical protein
MAVVMNTFDRQRWIRTAILFGAMYAVIGLALAAPANSAPADQVRIWRLTAWVISALAFAAHLWHEHFRVRNSPLTTAVHTSLAVALGAFGLAASANVHALWVGSSHQRLLTFALVGWPVLTGVPAFVVALILAAGLGLGRRSS